ncbi:MAG TPA: hypothetical protein VE263_04805 [Candidatus Angelobacter sp.]|nr:hypothetical protein [Candidatus Angelobacter sp.]
MAEPKPMKQCVVLFSLDEGLSPLGEPTGMKPTEGWRLGGYDPSNGSAPAF